MTETQQFIKDVKTQDPEHFDSLGRTIEYHLLSPRSWQAVGKTRGWKRTDYNFYEQENDVDAFFLNEWSYAMHRFINYLADGLTIEEALKAIR